MADEIALALRWTEMGANIGAEARRKMERLGAVTAPPSLAIHAVPPPLGLGGLVTLNLKELAHG